MVADATGPMNFGRRLRYSPTHNTLKLMTSKGGEVFVSSVVMSLNSPVIDHMTTTLHMTSVDMLEFSEAAVQVFVDAAYTGKFASIDKSLFRELNKMAYGFEMTWLLEKCEIYFSILAAKTKKPLFSELFFLFEEAAFAMENLKSKEFFYVANQRMEDLQCKRSFLDLYLKKANKGELGDKLTNKKLDMLIDFAGEEVHLVIQSVVDQLTLSKSHVTKGPILSSASRYLLENSNLTHCKMSNPDLFANLFDMLGQLPNEQIKWSLELYRSATETKKFCAPKQDQSTSDVVSGKIGPKRLRVLSNFSSSFDIDMSSKEFLEWLSTTGDVTNLTMAIEVVILWSRAKYNYTQFLKCKDESNVSLEEVEKKLCQLIKKKNWSPLPKEFAGYYIALPTKKPHENKDTIGYLKLKPLCAYEKHDHSNYVVIESVESPSIAKLDCFLELRSGFFGNSNKKTFYFQHPSVTSCNLPGNCGFILKLALGTDGGGKMILCTEPEDYRHDKSVHFHREIRSEKMVAYIGIEQYFLGIPTGQILHPISCMGSFFGLAHTLYGSCIDNAPYNRIKVLYDLDTSMGI